MWLLLQKRHPEDLIGERPYWWDFTVAAKSEFWNRVQSSSLLQNTCFFGTFFTQSEKCSENKIEIAKQKIGSGDR